MKKRFCVQIFVTFMIFGLLSVLPAKSVGAVTPEEQYGNYIRTTGTIHKTYSGVSGFDSHVFTVINYLNFGGLNIDARTAFCTQHDKNNINDTDFVTAKLYTPETDGYDRRKAAILYYGYSGEGDITGGYDYEDRYFITTWLLNRYYGTGGTTAAFDIVKENVPILEELNNHANLGDVPDGYAYVEFVPDDSKLQIIACAGGSVEKEGSLKIIKQDSHGQKIPSVLFHVSGPSGERDVTTDGNGEAFLDSLLTGTYTITETDFPENLHFVLHTTQETVTVTPGQEVTYTMTNDYQRGSTSLVKVNGTGFKQNEYMKLEGAVYQLYAAENIYEGQTLRYSENQLVRDNIVTKADGSTDPVTDLPVGKYYYKEVTPSEGFALSPDRVDAEVGAGQKGEEKAQNDNVEAPEKGKIKVKIKKVLSATDYDSQILLEGSKFSFTLIKRNGELSTDQEEKSYSNVTGNDGVASVELPYGKYRVHEEECPTDSIPVLDFDIDFTGKEVVDNEIYEYTLDTPITFAYYLENTNNNEYTMVGTKKAYVIDWNLNIKDIPNIENNFNEYFSKEILRDKNEYFEYNKTKTENELKKNINEVEDRVFNIYFDRKEYKLKFNVGKKEITGESEKNKIAVLDSNDSLVWTETEYIPTLKVNNNEVENNEYEISAKYGEYLEPKYPYLISNDNDEFNYTFIGWMTDEKASYDDNHNSKYVNDTYKILDENLILDSNNTEKVHELYAVWTATPKYYKYHYMLENLDQSTDESFVEGHKTEMYNNKIYTEFTYNDVIMNKVTENVNAHDDMLGYNKIHSEIRINKGDTQQGDNEYDPIDVYIFYDRKEYTLVIHNMNDEYIPTEISSEYKDKGIYLDKVDNRIKVKYGANLSMLDELKDKWIIDKENPLKYPDESKEIYEIENWYCSPDTKEKIDYNKFNFVNYENGMINIYANWIIKEDSKI